MSKNTKHSCLNKNEELVGGKYDGPVFGYNDICIKNNSNINNNSWSRLGYSYELPFGINQSSEEAKNYLSGSEYF